MSQKYSWNKQDLEKIGEGALIAAGGALLTYAPEVVTKIDWGIYSPIMVIIFSVAVNAGWKFIRGQQQAFDVPSGTVPNAPQATETTLEVQIPQK